MGVKARTLREQLGVKQVSSQQASFPGDFCDICCLSSTVHATPVLIVTSIYTAMGEASKNKQNEESYVLTKNFPDAARQLVELGPSLRTCLFSACCWAGNVGCRFPLKANFPCDEMCQTWWEQWPQWLRADSATGFKRGCIYRCVLTYHWESLIITHSAYTCVKMLISFLGFPEVWKEGLFMSHFNCVFIFQGSE